MNALDLCRLCSVPSELKGSHILPNFFVKSVGKETQATTPGKGPSAIVLNKSGEVKSGMRQIGRLSDLLGIKEKLLCASCEQLLGRRENRFRSFFYGTAPHPLRKQKVGTVIFSAPTQLLKPAREVREVTVDYADLKLFVLSLLWRASVANGFLYEAISIGRNREKLIGKALLMSDPGPDDFYPFIMADLVGQPGVENLFVNPTSGVDPVTSLRHFSFIMGGFKLIVFKAKPNRRVPKDIRTCGLRKKGQSGSILLLPLDATHIYQDWGNWVHESGFS